MKIARVPGGLKLRMAFVASSLVIAVAIGGAAVFTSVAEAELTRQFKETMGSLAANLAANAAHGVFIESGEALRDLAAHLMNDPDIVRVEIKNAKGKTILEQQDDERIGARDNIVVETDVLYDAASEHQVSEDFAPFLPQPTKTPADALPSSIGTVRLTYSRARLTAVLWQLRIRIWLAALVAALIGITIAVWLADRMVHPLRVLGKASASVAAGKLETKVPEEGDDELAALARSFNRMTDALRASRAQVEQTYGELARKDRLATLGQFTAVIAHELKNPLGVILSSAQVISNPKRTPEMKDRAAQFIIEEVRRLNSDLTGFLNFARPKPPELEPVDLAESAKRALDAWRQTPGSSAAHSERTPVPGSGPKPAGGIVASLAVEPGTPRASADPDQVHQVLLNLLLNASQAMQQARRDGGAGGNPDAILVDGRIDVSIAARNGQVALVVADDGPGMSDEVKKHVFEPFFTTKKRGSGLGLAVVEQIARAHGGAIELDSAPGKGTRFTLLLPAAP